MGVHEGLAHGGGGAFDGRVGDVAGVGGHSEADEFGEDGRVTGESSFEGFDGEDGGAFSESHAVAVGREGAAACGGDDAHRVPCAVEAEAEWGFVATGDGRGHLAGADHVEGESYGVSGGGAGGGDVERRAGDLEV